jgi:prepilin-type N-terminal cleavage/methylation domain-containing protein
MKAQRGFTLIEVMIAIVLSMIAVIGVTALYMVETRSSSDSRHKTEAAVLCEDKMEWLRTQLAPATGSESGLNELGGVGGMYSRSWSVTTLTTYIDYAVTVTWSEDGIASSETLRSRRGL